MEMVQRTLSEIDDEIERTKKALAEVRGMETEVYARIVGYYRAVRNWNKGKREEYNIRKMFELSSNEQYTVTEADTPCNCSSVIKIQSPTTKNTKVQNDSTELTYSFFARKTCPNCPPVKSYVENINIQGRMIDVDSEAGFSEAAKNGVFSAPTVIIYDKYNSEIARAHNVEELKEIFETVMA